MTSGAGGVTPSPESNYQRYVPKPPTIAEVATTADNFVTNWGWVPETIEKGNRVETQLQDFLDAAETLSVKTATLQKAVQENPTAYPSGLGDQLQQLFTCLDTLKKVAVAQSQDQKSAGFYLTNTNELQKIKTVTADLKSLGS